MRIFVTATATVLALAAPALAEGDAAKGEKEFKKCKSCHAITDAGGEAIVKGGRTGPDLYGVIGRTAGSVEDFRYGDGLQDAAEAGFAWTEDALAAYVADPKAWLGEQGFEAKSKMTYKLRKGGEDVAAYLATFSAE